jgi:hypothetical protein
VTPRNIATKGSFAIADSKRVAKRRSPRRYGRSRPFS